MSPALGSGFFITEPPGEPKDYRPVSTPKASVGKFAVSRGTTKPGIRSTVMRSRTPEPGFAVLILSDPASPESLSPLAALFSPL